MPRLDNSSVEIIHEFNLNTELDDIPPVDLCIDCWLSDVAGKDLEEFEIDHPSYEEVYNYRCYQCGSLLSPDDNVYWPERNYNA